MREATLCRLSSPRLMELLREEPPLLLLLLPQLRPVFVLDWCHQLQTKASSSFLHPFRQCSRASCSSMFRTELFLATPTLHLV